MLPIVSVLQSSLKIFIIIDEKKKKMMMMMKILKKKVILFVKVITNFNLNAHLFFMHNTQFKEMMCIMIIELFFLDIEPYFDVFM